MYGGRNNYNHSHHQHHHYPNHHHKGAPHPSGVAALSPESALAADIFEQFIAASTFKSVLHHYRHMCDVLRLRPQNIRHFYPKLKNKIRTWKAQALWSKFDKRATHKCYNHGKACTNTKVLIIGAGPCGLRTAIEAQLLGAKVVVVEKRDRFSRNNVLHLWPFVIADLKALGAKKFYGKFCAGAIDHISIRQLQCILLKVALLLGVEVFEGVTFDELLDPPEDQSQNIGWHARFSPAEHPVNQYEFDVLIGADGKRNTLTGFKRKEFRGKLAIAITANFINKHSEQEARVQEISGVAFIFNQKFFKDLYSETGIDLENIVYYKDETHYFVMTAKKHSLIDKGVILRDLPDTQQLLHPNNVDRQALCSYAREAADFSTGNQMPHLEFAVNHYGKPDIAMFDFTSMFAAENACRVFEKNGHKLLQCLVGDSLLEPFWPTGSGCARGFLSSFDACWAVRSWASNSKTTLEVIAERESIYRLLAQTTPENLGKDYSSYTLEPSSRYPTVNLKVLLPFQVRHLYLTDDPENKEIPTPEDMLENAVTPLEDLPRKRKRRDSIIQPDTLLSWCQKQVAHNENVNIEDLSLSFKDGRAFCAILHRYRPDLIDFESLNLSEHSKNCQMAFDIFEIEFGIQPVMNGEELVNWPSEDRLDLVSYISQIHDALRGEIPHSMGARPPLKAVKGQSLEGLDLEDFPEQPKNREKQRLFENNISSSSSSFSSHNVGKFSCRILEEPKAAVLSNEDLQKAKKRRNELGSLDANAYERRQDIERNREHRLRKLKEQRELDTIRFVRSMRMLHCDVRNVNVRPNVPSFRQGDDPGISEYRKNAKSMREKACELEKKLYFPEKMNEVSDSSSWGSNVKQNSEEFSDRVKGLEAKFRGDKDFAFKQKPKDMIRAIGKLEKTDWNLSAIERKIEDNPKPVSGNSEKEKVPKWTRDNYNDKYQNIERRLRENGEDEERIAKYLDIDASLKRLERKLREGSTLETGLRGHNKVSNLASQLSSKLVRKDEEKPMKNATTSLKQPRPMVLQTSGSDLCYFCGTKVYLVERLSAEGKFFHRQCFKCSYCGALLRLGNYIYDRENRYGGKFFCIPHFGITVRSRAPKKNEKSTEHKEMQLDLNAGHYFGRASVDTSVPSTIGAAERVSVGSVRSTRDSSEPPHLLSPPSKGSSPLDRGTTPERVEFENSVIEHSDEEEYLSEDEWTDRNFGASANELDDDDDDDDDDSDYSDLSDDEVDEEVLMENQQKLTVDETRRLAESWKRRYSNDVLEMSYDDDRGSFSESENGDMSEHGAEGDESHTPTEGEAGDDDDDEEDEGDDVKRARELRRLELNINFEAPPRKAETSDSGSETEVGSDEESDTQIDTDSEFADDQECQPPKEIPTIVIDEMPKDNSKEEEEEEENSKGSGPPTPTRAPTSADPDQKYIAQVVDMMPSNEKEGTERSASMSNLVNNSQLNGPNPHTEQLRRLLHRTESSELVSAQKNQLRRQYLLGTNSNMPRKSVSTADLGNRFKSFMDKISETQKKLNPAPQPSPAMQAFLNISNKSNGNSNYSSKDILQNSPNIQNSVAAVLESKLDSRDGKLGNELAKTEEKSNSEESDSSSKSEEGKLITFSDVNKDLLESSPLKKNESSSVSCNHHLNDTVVEGHLSANLSPEEESGGEKGTLDSEQSEKNILEKKLDAEDVLAKDFCLSAKNVDLIEAFNSSERKDAENTTGREEILDSFGERAENNDKIEVFSGNEAKNVELIEKLEGNQVEAINTELVNSENMKNVSSDVLFNIDLEEEKASNDDIAVGIDQLADENVDAVFDQLADDAIKELNDSQICPIALESMNNDFDLGGEYQPDKNAECGGENGQQPAAFEKKQDESGFKSLEDNKSLSSNGISNYPSPSEGEKRLPENLDNNKSYQEDILSPEAVTTEADLSDWGEDNDALSINAEVFETDFRGGGSSSKPHLNIKGDSASSRAIARIASLESLGDSDSAISVSMSKVVTQPKPSPFTELEGMEYMDTSGSESSHDEAPSVSIKYNVLQDCTPTTPPSSHDEKLLQEPFSPTNSVSLNQTSESRIKTPIKSKSLDIEKVCSSEKAISNRSLSEPPPNNSYLSSSSVTESSTFDSPSSKETSQLKSLSPKRYEGYIPRFKDRVVPFSLARDSLDVRKNSTPKPLFTPSREDILQREKNEADRLRSFSIDSSQSSPVSLSSSSSSKVKDGDLVKDMVMSRIPKKSADRNRRGSRNALHLSLTSSTSSIFGSEPSLDSSKASFNVDSQGLVKEDSCVSDKTRNLNVNSSVPSNENDNSVELSGDINSSSLSSSMSKALVSSPSEKKDDQLVRKVLPATPLTHPEKFGSEENAKRELFKSTPHLLQYSAPTSSHFGKVLGHSYPVSDHNQRFSEIPPLYNQNIHLSKSLASNVTESPKNSSVSAFRENNSSLNNVTTSSALKMADPSLMSDEIGERISKYRENLGFSGNNSNKYELVDKPNVKPAFAGEEMAEQTKKDSQERVKELLEERRRKESEENREVRLRNKDSCVQECLEEYRQKRSSAPVFTQAHAQTAGKGKIENGQTRAQLGLRKKHFHRPSLLELESMQIFSSSARDNSPVSVESASLSPNSNNTQAPAVVSSTTPTSEPSLNQSPQSKDNPPEKKSTKKSKDRERRRSLIQVVAGMFSKSDEKKKEKDGSDSNTKDQSSEKKTSPPSPLQTENSVVPPKSPSVKERFSKLRLSRSKEKKKSPPSDQKNRSASVDINPGPASESKQPVNSLSLPTSPSRTLFSFLSSSPAKLHDRGRSSTSGSSTSYFGQRFSPACIKEENNSEDETTYAGGANASKDSTISTPSLRRQKAALRAAKQAEQKRLRMAQEIQRQLEECEVKTRELEEKGISVEKALIGETDGACRDSSELMKEWFSLVHEKNTLVRWQEELTVRARELELEDRHVRLENELRQRMTSSEREKTRGDIEREGQILAEIISIIEQKDALVHLLEEDRQRYIEEDKDLELVHARKLLQRPQFERETGV